MTPIIAINKTFPEHLAAVTAEMRTRGAPVLRAIRDEDQGIILALEGSHRLVAAKALGLTPILQILGDDDMISCEEIGLDDCGTFEGEPARAADIRDYVARPMGTYAGCGEWLRFEGLD